MMSSYWSTMIDTLVRQENPSRGISNGNFRSILERINVKSDKYSDPDRRPADHDTRQEHFLYWYLLRQPHQCQDFDKLQRRALLETTTNRSILPTELHDWQWLVHFPFETGSCHITHHMPSSEFQEVFLIDFEYRVHNKGHEAQRAAMPPIETYHLLMLVLKHEYPLRLRILTFLHFYLQGCCRWVLLAQDQSQLARTCH